MLKANYHSKYNTVNKNGVGIVMFRYIVTGTAEELEAYKTAQGEHFRPAEDGRPYYFSPNWTGDKINLGITSKGKVFADTAPLDKVSSLISRYPGTLGQEIAKLAAAQILGDMYGTGARSSAPVQQQSDVDQHAETTAETKQDAEDQALDA